MCGYELLKIMNGYATEEEFLAVTEPCRTQTPDYLPTLRLVN
jgi:hypothetical protein